MIFHSCFKKIVSKFLVFTKLMIIKVDLNMEKVMSVVRAAVQKYDMIEEGDSIAVGVSGGKDSLFLLAALHSLSRYYPKKFTLKAITIDPCFNNQEADYSKISEMCRRLRIPYYIKRTELGRIIFENRKESNPCSLCARMRRGMLHDLCLELSCNKIALGHHGDDAVETFLMNLCYGGNIGCFSPVTYLSRKDITMIRPLIFCEDKEVRRIANKLSLPVLKSNCPVDGSTKRAEMTDLIKTLEGEFKDLKTKIMGAIERGNVSGWHE